MLTQIRIGGASPLPPTRTRPVTRSAQVYKKGVSGLVGVEVRHQANDIRVLTSDDEGLLWIVGHHANDCDAVKAMRVNWALIRPSLGPWPWKKF